MSICDNYRRNHLAQGVFICPVTGIAVSDKLKIERSQNSESKKKGTSFLSSGGLLSQDSLFPTLFVIALTAVSSLGWIWYHQSPPLPPTTFQPESPLPISCAQSQSPGGCLFVIGGKSSSKFDGGEIFFQSFNGSHWLQEPPLPKDLRIRHGGGADVLGGRLYVAGFSSPNSFLSFDGARWRSETWMPSVRTGYAVAAYEGHIYVLGGYSWLGVKYGGGLKSQVERFTPGTAFQAGSWSDAPPLSVARSGLAACVGFKRLFVMGGSYSNEVESFDGTAWRSERRLPQRLTGHAAIFNAGKLYVIGGYSYGKYQEAVASFTGQEWNRENPMFASRAWGACAPLKGLVHCLGGDSSPISNQQTYVPQDEVYPDDVTQQFNVTSGEVLEDLARRAMEYFGEEDGFWRLKFAGFLSQARNRHTMAAFAPQPPD